VNADFEDGELTKEVMKKFLAVHLPVQLKQFRYQLRLDPSRKHYDNAQTEILKEEVTSVSPDLMRLVQCLERGG
jgi:hypothetical protein